MKHICRTWNYFLCTNIICKALEYCKFISTRHTPARNLHMETVLWHFNLRPDEFLFEYIKIVVSGSDNRSFWEILFCREFVSSVLSQISNHRRYWFLLRIKRTWYAFTFGNRKATVTTQNILNLHFPTVFPFKNVFHSGNMPLLPKCSGTHSTRISCQTSMNTNCKIILKQIYHRVPEAICKWETTNSGKYIRVVEQWEKPSQIRACSERKLLSEKCRKYLHNSHSWNHPFNLKTVIKIVYKFGYMRERQAKKKYITQTELPSRSWKRNNESIENV